MLPKDGEVYAKYCDELTRFATMLVGPDVAGDAVAAGFAAALQTARWPSIEERRAYLYQAVLNQARMMQRTDRRRARNERRAAFRDVGYGSPTPRPEVIAAVARLSERQRAVVYLASWEDLDPTSIGALLGISDGAVRRHLARARTSLRKVLDA
jgi:DNA-directed RNA polymerase specialized sigma24 family protein